MEPFWYQRNSFFLVLKCISQLSASLCLWFSILNKKTSNFFLWQHFSPLISGLYEIELFNFQCTVLSLFLLAKTFDLHENMLWFENNDLGLNKESRAVSESMQNNVFLPPGNVTLVALCSAGAEALSNIFALKISQITLIWKTASNHAGRQ